MTKHEFKTITLNNLGFRNEIVTKKFCDIAKKYDSNITMWCGCHRVDCKNPIAVMFLNNNRGDILHISAEGDDSKNAIEELKEFIYSTAPKKEDIKVVFLDVDGVLNSVRDDYDIDLNSGYHLKLLQKIIKSTGAKIVLSSSWRRDVPLMKFNLLPRLEEYGMEIMDCTPYICNGSCRGDEIREWIKRTEYGITQFAILDDNNDMAEFTDTNLIQTNTKFGLQEIDAIRCIDLLNGNNG